MTTYLLFELRTHKMSLYVAYFYICFCTPAMHFVILPPAASADTRAAAYRRIMHSRPRRRTSRSCAGATMTIGAQHAHFPPRRRYEEMSKSPLPHRAAPTLNDAAHVASAHWHGRISAPSKMLPTPMTPTAGILKLNSIGLSVERDGFENIFC